MGWLSASQTVVLASSILALSLFSSQASADCECGYSVNATSSRKHAVFTDLFETDFLHLQSIQENKDWVPQTYTTGPSGASPWGKNASIKQIVANPIAGRYSYKGQGRNGGDPGLQLYVRSGAPRGGSVPIAELVTQRRDMLYGTFRSAIKYTAINGTCGAFFFYDTDTAEIDMELLSSQIRPDNNDYTLYLVMHYGPGKSNFNVFKLPFNPTTNYHEYRFDWSPGSVDFYADGKILSTLTTGAPSTPGGMRLMHWSTGDPYWSRGPPEQDAVMTVSYVKAYFNSSDPARNDKAYSARCHHLQKKSSICRIPENAQGKLPDPVQGGGETWFFTAQKNMTEGQNYYELPYYGNDARQQQKKEVRKGGPSRVMRGSEAGVPAGPVESSC